MKTTPLYSIHKALNARIIEFGGWQMPVQYTGIVKEHQAVRHSAGLFDVSHMGEFYVAGKDAKTFLQRMTTNDLNLVAEGQAQYTLLCTQQGTVIDDLILYRLSEQEFLLCVNASNTAKDFEWLTHHLKADESVTLEDQSDAYALLALQGPAASKILSQVTPMPIAQISSFRLQRGKVAGVDTIVARTGYTGEDGFELFMASSAAERVWSALMEAGQPSDLLPAGLGARDTLRLEMGYSLYGHEITQDISPLEAGLGWVVKLNKSAFIGQEALIREKTEGSQRCRIGFVVSEKGIARQGYAIADPDCWEIIGEVTSGTHAPSLSKAIGMGLVQRPAFQALKQNTVAILIRDRPALADIVSLPFYHRQM